MAAKFAEIFIKLGLKKEGFDKEIKSTKANFKSLGQDLLKTGAIIGGVATGAVLAGKAIFEMGKQGAAVIQTGESFEFLLEKVGAAPDLLDQLRDATLGTVDDMTLMESTLTLTAGAGDDLSKMMMNAAPQLAEIAKAANKLNPALGDTAFMYQSIGTGVKRAQPLILDNLGLTIKVGDANEEFAESIGKTVEQLTAEEKSMAILNATLEAGDTLIAQVGGSVEAAGDEMAIAEAKIANMTDELKTRLVPVVADASDKFIEFIDAMDKSEEPVQALIDAEKNLIITRERQLELLDDYKNGVITAEELIKILTDATEDYNEELNMTAEATGWAAGQDRELITAKEDLIEVTDDAVISMGELGLAALGANDEIGGLAGVLEKELQQALKAATDSVFELERAKFLMKLATQNLSQAEREQAIATLASIRRVETLSGAVKDGTVSQEDYLQALMDGEVTIEEYNELMGIAFDVTDKFGNELDDTKTSLEELMGTDWVIKIKYVAFGAIPDPRGFAEKGIPVPGGQHGLSMIVPPGFPNDSFPVLASSGEHVQVTPRGSRGGGNSYTYVRYGDQNIIENPAQAAFLIEKERQAEFDEIDKVI